MKIRIYYLAQLKNAIGRAEEVIDLPQSVSDSGSVGFTVGQLLAHLGASHPPLRRLLLTSEGTPQPTLLIFVRDEQTSVAHVLHDGEEVTLLTPIAGGALSEEERARYAWQLWIPGFGEAGQQRLRSASVLISRVGGVGGVVAYQLAAAGIGKLVLAHGGTIQPSDLNRQLLMTHAGLGQARMQIAPVRLRELNPLVQIEPVAENVSEENAAGLVQQVDVVVSCAPRFPERLLLNREAIRQNKPLVDCAMYGFEVQLTTILPGRTPCLACLYPEPPPAWDREFPVFGAVAGMVGSLGAVEVIKLVAELGQTLEGRLLLGDLATMAFRQMRIHRRPECAVCGGFVSQ